MFTRRKLIYSGIKKLVVYVNKVDIMDDEEMLELVELEIQELLEKYGFDPEETPIVFGSARYVFLCTFGNLTIHGMGNSMFT